MQGRIYDERLIRLYFVTREIYYPNYRKELAVPAIKAPLKVLKENPFSNLPQISKSAHIATKTAP